MEAAFDWDWSRPVYDHVHLRVADVGKSRDFYATVLEPLGIPLLMDLGHMALFPNLALSADGPASERVHVAFRADSQEAVQAFHAAGLDAGYTDNGAPGPRDYMPGYYSAYLLDPDGNNIEAVHRDVQTGT